MKLSDTSNYKFSAIKTFMKNKEDIKQEGSFKNQRNYDASLIKNKLVKASRSKNNIHEVKQKKHSSSSRFQNQSLSLQKIDHFRSISMILNQQNVNLNQQKIFLLNQIKFLQQKDKAKKKKIKQMKHDFRQLQKNYLQLQKLNLITKYKFEALQKVVQNLQTKQDSHQTQCSIAKQHNKAEEYIKSQELVHNFNLNSKYTLDLSENISYLKYLPQSTVKSISSIQIQKYEQDLNRAQIQHFPISLKQINKTMTLNELFQILQNKFQKLMLQYRAKMDQNIRKQYRQLAKCIKNIKTCLQQYNKQKKGRTTSFKANNNYKKYCPSVSEQLSTSCFRSRQQQSQQIPQKHLISFQKYIS